MEPRGSSSTSTTTAIPCNRFYAPPKTPPKNLKETLPAPRDTPTHIRCSSTMPQTSTNVFFEHPFVEAAAEMTGKFWGPVTVEDFFDEFLDVETEPIPEIDFKAVKDVAEKRLETDMYNPLIAALNPFCRGIKLVNTSASEDPEYIDPFGHKVKPDMGIYDEMTAPKPGEPLTQAKLMVGSGELKNDLLAEPFELNHPLYAAENFETDTAHGRDTRGQLAVYANAIQSTQYRTHSFSFFINKNLCRLIHWSRSCAIVTVEFDYTKQGHLHEFFWRLSHASDDVRGIDTTFDTPKKQKEAALARMALKLNSIDQIHQVEITDSITKKMTRYIVHEAFTNNHIYLLGRGTRCFKAFDCQTREIVVLKDSWRVSKYDPEGDTYRRLHEKEVPYIPKFVTAGDVPGISQRCGQVRLFCITAKESLPRIHIHYRLVLGSIGEPLKTFSSTWELVKAVNCALIAHREAATKAKILHRDISVGNIMIMGEGGMLIDWELSKRIDPETLSAARSEEKTGTFQFISARLLMQTTTVHTIGDDLESFVYVLTFLSIKHAKNFMSDQDRATALQVFDYSYAGVGGRQKMIMLKADISSVDAFCLDQKLLTDLFDVLFSKFGLRYRSVRFLMKNKVDTVATAAEVQELETHDWICSALEAALRNEEWKEAGDRALEQEVYKEQKNLTDRQKKRKSLLEQYAAEREQKRLKNA